MVIVAACVESTVLLEQGEQAAAERRLRSIVAQARREVFKHPAVEVLIALADVCRRRGEYDEAQAFAEEAVALAEKSEYRLLEAEALRMLARVRRDRRDVVSAAELARGAVELHRVCGHLPGERRVLALLVGAV